MSIQSKQIDFNSAKASAMITISGVKVFSATKAKEREALGDNVTKWLKHNPNVQVVDKIVTQSSDSEFHCLTITIFYDMPSSLQS